MDSSDDVPFVQLPVKLNGKLHNLLLEIDTGSDRIIDLDTPFVNKNRLLDTQKPFAISRIASSDGGSGDLHLVNGIVCRYEERIHHKFITVYPVIAAEKGQKDKNKHDGANYHRQDPVIQENGP